MLKNRLLTYLIYLIFTASGGISLLSCSNWELPGKKSQRSCTKPSGTLSVQVQQRKVDLAITGSSGTIDRVIWDFGNNSTTATTGLTVSYTYPTSNTYVVRATLTNSCGNSFETTLQQTINVSDAVAPTVTLQPATAILPTGATLQMAITSNGNATIMRYGICYSSTNTTPEIGRDIVLPTEGSLDLNTAATFILMGLTRNTLYYVRSFARNSVSSQVGYSSPVQTFRTGDVPSITTGTATAGITTATVNFTVMATGTPAAVEYGICYSSTTNMPDINATTVKVASPALNANVPVLLSDLITNRIYYYRAYAKTASGDIIYGNIVSFTTQVDTLSQDLIASVSFTSQSLLDISGNNNNVRLVGSPTFTTDRKGTANAAIQLNGTSDYFFMPENSTLNPTALSVSIWIRPAPVTGTAPMQIYNKSRFSDGTAELYSSLIRQNPSQSGFVFINTDIKQNSDCRSGMGWQTFPFNIPQDPNKWHHVVMSYSGRSVRMYYDNVLSYSVDNLPNSTMDPCPGGDLKFGAQSRNLPYFFSGAMDDIRIYKRALTPGEVQTLFTQ